MSNNENQYFTLFQMLNNRAKRYTPYFNVVPMRSLQEADDDDDEDEDEDMLAPRCVVTSFIGKHKKYTT